MPFPRRLLNEHEELVIDQNPHPWFFAGPGAATLGALVALLVVLVWGGDGGAWDVLKIALCVLVVAALLWTLGRAVRWRSTMFVVTSDRVVFRNGVFSKRGIEIPLDRVNTVFFHQPLIERMVGAGDLVIESGGEQGRQTFTDISHPSEVQNEIYRQIEADKQRTFGARDDADDPPRPSVPDADVTTASLASTPTASIPDQITQLDELRRRGLLTDAEFEAKKAELLGRM